MIEKIDPVPPPPSPEDGIPWRIIWLAVAFLPALVGICTMGKNGGSQAVWVFLLILNIICAFAASIGLGTGRASDTRFLLVFLLGPVFFVLNFGIVVFVGCSQQSFGA